MEWRFVGSANETSAIVGGTSAEANAPQIRSEDSGSNDYRARGLSADDLRARLTSGREPSSGLGASGGIG